MSFFKPPWVEHSGSSSICSVDIQPGGLRFATGGVDGCVNIWSTLPLLHPNLECYQELKKPLASLSPHQGGTQCVRWSTCGRYLASAGDDGTVVIHECRAGFPPGAAISILSGTSLNIASKASSSEWWVPRYILKGADILINEVCWSPTGRRLATSTIDGKINIWALTRQSSTTQSGPILITVPLTSLSGHSSWAQGLAWDPFGKYLLSTGGDRSVLLWSSAHEKGTPVMETEELYASNRCFFHKSSVSVLPAPSALSTGQPSTNALITGTLASASHVSETESRQWRRMGKSTTPFARATGTTQFRRIAWLADGTASAAAHGMHDTFFTVPVYTRYAHLLPHLAPRLPASSSRSAHRLTEAANATPPPQGSEGALEEMDSLLPCRYLLGHTRTVTAVRSSHGLYTARFPATMLYGSSGMQGKGGGDSRKTSRGGKGKEQTSRTEHPEDDSDTVLTFPLLVTGGNDRSIALWSPHQTAPLLVMSNCFNAPVSDLSVSSLLSPLAFASLAVTHKLASSDGTQSTLMPTGRMEPTTLTLPSHQEDLSAYTAVATPAPLPTDTIPWGIDPLRATRARTLDLRKLRSDRSVGDTPSSSATSTSKDAKASELSAAPESETSPHTLVLAVSSDGTLAAVLLSAASPSTLSGATGNAPWHFAPATPEETLAHLSFAHGCDLDGVYRELFLRPFETGSWGVLTGSVKVEDLDAGNGRGSRRFRSRRRTRKRGRYSSAEDEDDGSGSDASDASSSEVSGESELGASVRGRRRGSRWRAKKRSRRSGRGRSRRHVSSDDEEDAESTDESDASEEHSSSSSDGSSGYGSDSDMEAPSQYAKSATGDVRKIERRLVAKLRRHCAYITPRDIALWYIRRMLSVGPLAFTHTVATNATSTNASSPLPSLPPVYEYIQQRQKNYVILHPLQASPELAKVPGTLPFPYSPLVPAYVPDVPLWVLKYRLPSLSRMRIQQLLSKMQQSKASSTTATVGGSGAGGMTAKSATAPTAASVPPSTSSAGGGTTESSASTWGVQKETVSQAGRRRIAPIVLNQEELMIQALSSTNELGTPSEPQSDQRNGNSSNSSDQLPATAQEKSATGTEMISNTTLKNAQGTSAKDIGSTLLEMQRNQSMQSTDAPPVAAAASSQPMGAQPLPIPVSQVPPATPATPVPVEVSTGCSTTVAIRGGALDSLLKGFHVPIPTPPTAPTPAPAPAPAPVAPSTPQSALPPSTPPVPTASISPPVATSTTALVPATTATIVPAATTAHTTAPQPAASSYQLPSPHGALVPFAWGLHLLLYFRALLPFRPSISLSQYVETSAWTSPYEVQTPSPALLDKERPRRRQARRHRRRHRKERVREPSSRFPDRRGGPIALSKECMEEIADMVTKRMERVFQQQFQALLRMLPGNASIDHQPVLMLNELPEVEIRAHSGRSSNSNSTNSSDTEEAGGMSDVESGMDVDVGMGEVNDAIGAESDNGENADGNSVQEEVVVKPSTFSAARASTSANSNEESTEGQNSVFFTEQSKLTPQEPLDEIEEANSESEEYEEEVQVVIASTQESDRSLPPSSSRYTVPFLPASHFPESGTMSTASQHQVSAASNASIIEAVEAVNSIKDTDFSDSDSSPGPANPPFNGSCDLPTPRSLPFSAPDNDAPIVPSSGSPPRSSPRGSLRDSPLSNVRPHTAKTEQQQPSSVAFSQPQVVPGPNPHAELLQRLAATVQSTPALQAQIIQQLLLQRFQQQMQATQAQQEAPLSPPGSGDSFPDSYFTPGQQ